MAKAAKHEEHGNAHGSAMDYSEHERTYDWFIWLTKWSVIFLVALMLAMAAGFFTSAGWVGGTLLLIVLMAVSIFVF
ncbi:MAG TPA: aa3-type cytochrome c oxidase subunit IV [Rhizobiaceae bacterium]|nr:aa3-type cytochrome c oxidase subunit IV [Rhizobiaceae bacterium]